MKKFLIETILFALCLGVLIFIMKIGLPYHWGNPLMGDKLDYMEDHLEEYDTYFFGSSKTYRHIIPEEFDQIAGTKSFNMGGPAVFQLETHFLMDQFLQGLPTDKKVNVFLQSLKMVPITDVNFHTNRSKYFMDLERCQKGVQTFWNKKNYQQVYRHIHSYLENKLLVGQVLESVKYRFRKPLPFLDEIIAQKGFYSLDQEIISKPTARLKRRNSAYVKNNKYQKQVNKLAGKSKHKVNNMITEKLRIGDHLLHHNYYHIKAGGLKADMYFDTQHFNEKGASVFTKAIAPKFKKLKKK